MGRAYYLTKESERILEKMRFGAYRTRQARLQEVRLFIRDLLRLGAPASLAHLKEKNFYQLVNYWKRRQLSHRTIANKLSILRYFFKNASFEVTVPDNAYLKIKNPPLKKAFSLEGTPEVYLGLVEHSFTQSLLAFQFYFGLTKMESFRLVLEHALLNPGQLLIDRTLACNKKDRIIPIQSKPQKQAIRDRKTLLGAYTRLTERVAESHLLGLYNADLHIQGLNPRFPYRYYYAQTRYQILVSLSHYSREKALHIIQTELGLTSKRHLKRFI